MPTTDARRRMPVELESPLGMTPVPDARAQRLDRDRSLLLVIDIQERLAPHVQDHATLIARTDALLLAARHFGIPAFLTEHCPTRIGPALAPLRTRFDADRIFAKSRFGAMDHPEFAGALEATGRRQVVVAGMEAHVCVLQTTLGLIARGFAPFVVSDAVGSRPHRQDDRRLALERLRDAGCTLVGTETALFEWARAGDDAAFREVLGWVKALE
jgi:nicotinamidase-related amidase